MATPFDDIDFARRFLFKNGNDNHWPAGTPGGKGGDFAPKGKGVPVPRSPGREIPPQKLLQILPGVGNRGATGYPIQSHKDVDKWTEEELRERRSALPLNDYRHALENRREVAGFERILLVPNLNVNLHERDATGESSSNDFDWDFTPGTVTIMELKSPDVLTYSNIAKHIIKKVRTTKNATKENFIIDIGPDKELPDLLRKNLGEFNWKQVHHNRGNKTPIRLKQLLVMSKDGIEEITLVDP